MRKIKFAFIILMPLFWHANATADTSGLDDLAACARLSLAMAPSTSLWVMKRHLIAPQT